MAIGRVVYGVKVPTVRESAKLLLNEVPEDCIWDLEGKGGSPDIVIGVLMAEIENHRTNTDQGVRLFLDASESEEIDRVRAICESLQIAWNPCFYLVVGAY